MLLQLKKRVKIKLKNTKNRCEYIIIKPIYLLFFNKKDQWLVSSNIVNKEAIKPLWSFHNEEWVQITQRWSIRKALTEGKKIDIFDTNQNYNEEVSIDDNSFKISCINKTNDEWIMIYIKPENYYLSNYLFESIIKFETLFKEFQIDFRYQDLFNRYRYRFQGNRIYFDIIYNGEFISNLSCNKFQLDKYKKYYMKITVINNVFQLWINGEIISTDIDIKNRLKTGSIALILWEDNNRTNMKMTITPTAIYTLDTEKVINDC